MSNQIPDFLKYVASIEITNGGSGYSSPVTITISGGGGTGATATVDVLDGVIHTVQLTNIGENYTSAPTITVTGLTGSGAVLEATLGFATGNPTIYDEKTSTSIKYTLPEFIRDDYSKFIQFIEKYYEYMDSAGNPINLLLNKKYSDIDDLEAAELDKRAIELANDFPQILLADRKNLLKNIKKIYESKGSERSIKAYFKLIYNEEVDVYYPSRDILRASDGVWTEETSVRASAGYDNYEVSNLNGTLADIIYYETIGSVTFARTIPITIPRVSKIAHTLPQIYEVAIKLPEGITEIPGPGADATAEVVVSSGVITSITVTNGGLGYIAAPVIEISGGTGVECRAVVSNGVITSIVVTKGGTGYTGSSVVTFNTDSVRTFIVERGGSLAESNVKAYIDRIIVSVTTGTYSGSNAGFITGQIYTNLNEVGQTSQNAIIRIDALDAKNSPSSWSIINPGRRYTKSQFNITIGSRIRETVVITLNTGYLFREQGKFKDDRGKLSNVNRIQDNYRYQSYSYIIKTGLAETEWKKRYKDLMHPAGLEVFGDLIISNNIALGGFFNIFSEGLHIHTFELQDYVTGTEVFTRVVQWYRDFNDVTTNSDSEFFTIGKNIVDVSVISDDYIQDYVVSDYLPLNYTGAGISKFVEKVLIDTATPIDTFSPALQYNRSHADTTLASEIFSAGVSRLESDAVSTIDVLTYLMDLGLPISDTVSISDDYDQEYVEAGYVPLYYIGSGMSKAVEKSIDELISTTEVFERVINTSKDILETLVVSQQVVKTLSLIKTESVSASASGVLSISNYAPTYFGEDYVGESRNL